MATLILSTFLLLAVAGAAVIASHVVRWIENRTKGKSQ